MTKHTADTGKKIRRWKVTEFDVPRVVKQRTQLRHAEFSHRRAGEILRDQQRWLDIAKKRKPGLDTRKLAIDIAKRQKTTQSEIARLRKAAGPARNQVMRIVFDPEWWKHWPFPYWLKWVAFEQKGITFDKRWAGLGGGSATCSAISGVAQIAQESVSTVTAPVFPATTIVSNTFQSLATSDYIGMSFGDFSINVNDSTILLDDSFEVADVLRFDLPDAPCKGRFEFTMNGHLSMTPFIGGLDGLVRVTIQVLVGFEGPGYVPVDPTDLDSYSTIFALGRDSPGSYSSPIIQAIPLPWSLAEVNAGDKIKFYICLRVQMAAADGVSSFAVPGSEAYGSFILARAAGAADPGISYAFTPDA